MSQRRTIGIANSHFQPHGFQFGYQVQQSAVKCGTDESPVAQADFPVGGTAGHIVRAGVHQVNDEMRVFYFDQPGVLKLLF